MRTAQEQLEGNIRFLQRVSVLQKLPEPKDHVLAKISDLIRIVNMKIFANFTSRTIYLQSNNAL